MTEETQNLDSGMNNPTPDTVAMGVFQHDSKRYQPVFVMVPQYDGEMAEIAPKRVGDQSDSAVPLPVYDQLNELNFQAIQAILTSIDTNVIRMPYGGGRGWPGQATLSDDTETELVANPFFGNPDYVIDLKVLLIDNDSDNPCRVFIRPSSGSATEWPFRCPSKETRTYIFSGVGPQGAGGESWYAQLEATPTGGNIIVSGFCATEINIA